MKEKAKNIVLIVAAGSGTRLNNDIPKQYIDIHGKSVLRRSIEKYQAVDGIDKIYIVIHPDHEALYQQSVVGLDIADPVYGGGTRKDSVYNGLKAMNAQDNDTILIHDAARPFVSKDHIESIIQSMHRHNAATLAVPVSDTLRTDTGQHIDRNGLWAVQTPQAFKYGTIMRAHDHKDSAAATDDASLMDLIGESVHIVPGSRMNFKITDSLDLEMAEMITQTKKYPMIRTGHGFDVHAFDKTENKNGHVTLCGVQLPHPYPLIGHSDADVGLHAITDALLGAIADGDIGQHFPPGDPANKDKDSADFLTYAVERVRTQGGVIQNIDLTLICEAPKIGPHRDAMQNRVAEIAGLNKTQVSIKATTTEKLGFTGRSEGIAAQAIATIITGA